ncbi:MAG: HD domain-containing protein [Acidobacteriota bacterium]|nr:HD domain-containing protein [Acidobacteriota bacterium]
MLSVRDPIHGFIRADALEEALINSRPMQRLRFIHQLGFTHLVYPGAEHSRFSHVLGAMHLAGTVYDRLAANSGRRLPEGPHVPQRRLVRAAALLHDIGHAPFSHSAEDLFENGMDHEDMTRRLLELDEIAEIFQRHGDGLEAGQVIRLLKGGEGHEERLLAQIVSGELDVDKMDYLRRDSLYCGVHYGNYDLERLLDTMLPLEDPQNGTWGIGVDEGGVHALEALILARYYMFTQVYFNVTGKVLELHFNEWLRETGRTWPSDPEAFLVQDDVWSMAEMRRSESRHARAITERRRFTLAFESREHLEPDEKRRLEAMVPELKEQFGEHRLLISNSEKSPHRLGISRVLVRGREGALEPMEHSSQFLRHMTRIDRYRIYSPPEAAEQVAAEIRRRLQG